MFKWVRCPWFEARALGVLQVYYDQPLKKPLPPFEGTLLREAVNSTLSDGGTPFDAATRFYAAFAKTAMDRGIPLANINFAGVTGRMFALRDHMRFYDEHHQAISGIGQAEKRTKSSA